MSSPSSSDAADAAAAAEAATLGTASTGVASAVGGAQSAAGAAAPATPGDMADDEKDDVPDAEEAAVFSAARSPVKGRVVASEEVVGIVYDKRMKAHQEPTGKWHPERPARISSIWRELKHQGLTARCRRIQPRHITKDEVLLCHSQLHWDRLQDLGSRDLDDLRGVPYMFNSVYMNARSVFCASLSAGSVLEATAKVITGEMARAVAVVRPPGHHAEQDEPMGFCFYNNVALAAKMATETYKVERVMIVDWDVHHGNGTQHMFWNDPNILYVSLHRWDRGSFYPGGQDPAPHQTGGEAAPGKNINVAFSGQPMEDGDYLAAFHQVLLPVMAEFKPQLILVSCGFDAAEGDPLGGYHISPSGYAMMTYLLMAYANAKIVVALEGGYNLKSISVSMASVVRVLLGERPAVTKSLTPSMAGMKSIQETVTAHKALWECFHGHGNAPVDVPVESSSPTSASGGTDDDE